MLVSKTSWRSLQRNNFLSSKTFKRRLVNLRFCCFNMRGNKGVLPTLKTLERQGKQLELRFFTLTFLLFKNKAIKHRKIFLCPIKKHGNKVPALSARDHGYRLTWFFSKLQLNKHLKTFLYEKHILIYFLKDWGYHLML